MNKKQFLLPITILVLSVAGYGAALQLKKAPLEKEVVDNIPLVTVQVIKQQPVHFSVGSYGMLKSQFETDLVAQVSGEIIFLSQKFVRGGFVKKGELLAKIDANDYEAALIDANASIASAQAALVLEEANADVAKEQWRKIKNSTPTALSLREPQVAQERARLLSSQAGLKRAKRNLERTFIRAPYDALIDARVISLGSYVSTGMSLGKVFSTDSAEIRLPVAENELQYLINNGQQANVTFSVTSAGKKQQWTGRVIRNEGVIDQRSHMNYLVASINDPYQLKHKSSPGLRFGTYLSARISGIKIDNISIIARHLITESRVAIVDQSGQLQFQAVTVARIVDGKAYISEGLNKGTKVITSALDYPIAGMAVSVKEDIPVINKQEESNAPPVLPHLPSDSGE